MDAARRTVGVLAQPDFPEAHPKRVVDQETTDERFADPEDQLQGLGGLDGADHARQNTEHAAFSAARHQTGGRRLGVQTAVARTVLRREDGRLPLEAEDAAVGVGTPLQHAGVVHEIPGGEVVGPVEDDVVRGHDLPRIRRCQRAVVRFDAHSGIHRFETRRRRGNLRAADVGGGMEDLALEVARVHSIEIHESQRPDSRGGKVQRRRRSEPARADAQHAGRLELPLSVESDLGQSQVTAIAFVFRVRQIGEIHTLNITGGVELSSLSTRLTGGTEGRRNRGWSRAVFAVHGPHRRDGETEKPRVESSCLRCPRASQGRRNGETEKLRVESSCLRCHGPLRNCCIDELARREIDESQSERCGALP